MPTVAEIIQYYINLLIIQYTGKPNIEGTVSALVDAAIAENVVFDIRDGFNIATAVGAQLDIIGKYVGIDRFYTGSLYSGEHFAFLTYTDDTPSAIQTGFSDYTDFETKEGRTLKYADIVSGTLALGDDDYRTILLLKILQNNINHSHQSIDQGLFDFFGTSVRADSTGDMLMTYFIPETETAVIEVAVQKDVLPRPMGVGIQNIIVRDEDVFGFATYSGFSSTTKGFSTYSDFDTKVGEVLTYNKILEA